MRSSDLRIYRVASLMLVNAMLFQEIISSREPVKTLRKTIETLDIVNEFNRQWKYIEEEIDFVPIFKVARDILLALPASAETDKGLVRLANSAIKISRNRAALRHDLMGRIFHRLLVDAKFFGAFYTKIPAATLLLRLAIRSSNWQIDWTDAGSVGNIHAADLACGTGTLLKAALGAIVDRHIEETISKGMKASPDEVHRKLVENGLWGFDVLSSAVHLAATAIAMHDPRITVKTMRLYSLPLGGRFHNLGSIDFAKGKTLHVQKTLIGASIGPEEATTKKKTTIALPSLQIITMNPPFTRSVYGNLLFGGLSSPERGELQERLRNVLDETGLKANITAGLGSAFVAIADRLVSEEGVLALVLPKSVLSGATWEPTRSLFKGYHLQYAICSHEPNNWNFSESTGLSEVLLVLSKGESNQEADTVFINLWRQPKTDVEALSIAGAVQRLAIAGLAETSGTSEIRTDGQKYGEMIKISLRRHTDMPWSLPMSFAQTDLSRIAYQLSKDKIFLPGSGEVGSLKTVKLSSVAELGPDGRDVDDGFSLTDSPTPYPAFWGYNAESLSQMTQAPNKYLSPLAAALPGRHLRDANLLWSRAGTLMLPKELRLTTSRVVGVVLSSNALSNVWWPTKWSASDAQLRLDMERRLALWFNSTLGLFSMLMKRQETEGAWVKFPKAWYKELSVLDLVSLTKHQTNALDELWSQVKNKDLLPFPQISHDQTRKVIDDVFSETLGIPAIDILRELLSREPPISMQPL